MASVPEKYNFAVGNVLLPLSGHWKRLNNASESGWGVDKHLGWTKERSEERDKKDVAYDVIATASYALAGSKGWHGPISAGIWTKGGSWDVEFVWEGVVTGVLRRTCQLNDDFTGAAKYKDLIQAHTYTVSSDGSSLTYVCTITRRGETLGSYKEIYKRTETYEATVARLCGKPYTAPIGGHGGPGALREMEAKIAEGEMQLKRTQEDAERKVKAAKDKQPPQQQTRTAVLVAPPPACVPWDYFDVLAAPPHEMRRQRDGTQFLLAFGSAKAAAAAARAFMALEPVRWGPDTRATWVQWEARSVAVTPELAAWLEFEPLPTPRKDRGALSVIVDTFENDWQDDLDTDRGPRDEMLTALGVPPDARHNLDDAAATADEVDTALRRYAWHYKVLYVYISTHGAVELSGRGGVLRNLCMYPDGEDLSVKAVLDAIRDSPAHILLIIDSCEVQGFSEGAAAVNVVTPTGAGLERVSLATGAYAYKPALEERLLAVMNNFVVPAAGGVPSRAAAAVNDAVAAAVAAFRLATALRNAAGAPLYTAADDPDIAIAALTAAHEALRCEVIAAGGPKGHQHADMQQIGEFIAAFSRAQNAGRRANLPGPIVSKEHLRRAAEAFEVSVHDHLLLCPEDIAPTFKALQRAMREVRGDVATSAAVKKFVRRAGQCLIELGAAVHAPVPPLTFSDECANVDTYRRVFAPQLL